MIFTLIYKTKKMKIKKKDAKKVLTKMIRSGFIIATSKGDTFLTDKDFEYFIFLSSKAKKTDWPLNETTIQRYVVVPDESDWYETLLCRCIKNKLASTPFKVSDFDITNYDNDYVLIIKK